MIFLHGILDAHFGPVPKPTYVPAVTPRYMGSNFLHLNTAGQNEIIDERDPAE